MKKFTYRKGANMKYIILLISISLIISGCAKAPMDKKIVAKVNNETITEVMLNDKIDELPEYYQSAATQHKKEILDDVIVEKLLYEEARKRKLHKDDDVKKLIDKAAKKILIAKLLEIETSVEDPISDEDIELYYRQNKEQFLIPEKVKASHILLSSEDEAKNVLAELDAGADFSDLARKYSKDLTKDRGGDLGYFQRGQMIPEFENVCFAIKPGQTSGIVKTRFGYHIIKVTDKRAAEYKQLGEVKETIESKLLDQTKQEQFKALVEALKSKAKIVINEEAFKEAPTEPSLAEPVSEEEVAEND
ncbi:MAG: peptidylprolyl isomerase [Candidatus Omnitrophota bacterium]